MLKPNWKAWQHDRIGVLGIGSAVVAMLLWAWPAYFYVGSASCYTYPSTPQMLGFTQCRLLDGKQVNSPTVWLDGYFSDSVLHFDGWFSAYRVPAIAAILALAVILLLLRRR